MEERNISFTLRVFTCEEELPKNDLELLQKAKAVLHYSYSPYSNFKVAAAALLENGEVLTGTNQENAAFPAGVCAEGTVLGAVASLFPNTAITTLAIAVKSDNKVISEPAAPCGICRQQLLEHESRFNQNIRIILAAEQGPVYVVNSIKDILPLYFSSASL